MSTAENKAVFLSYASQDAEVVQHIAEALRSVGAEVWFDKNELVGGDAWDAKIRNQIKACALFIPVISAASQARREGYFRLEWKLAAQRTQTIADGTPFLLPIVIDATHDADALVPEEFRSVQWTQLHNGEVAPAFVTRVKHLLNGSSASTHSTPSVGSTPSFAPPERKSPLPLAAIAGLFALVLGLVAFIALRPATKEIPVAPPKPVAEPKAAPAVPVATDKSIAVLPFDNMSEDKTANAFFADGIHEDILTNLSNIRELRVVSRTSVVLYRDSHKPLPQIAQELGVAYILEGSVRRFGNKVRVTGQLIKARTDEHVWAKAYDRDLTDIFAIQAELSQEIATALQAAISPLEKTLLERHPTENLAAYDLYLKAREALRGSGVGGRERFAQQEPLLQAAVTLDPKFAAGWAELAHIHSDLYANDSDTSPAQLAKAKAAIDRAVQLAPDAPEVIFNLGDYYYHCPRDYPRAIEQFEKLVRLLPNNAEGYAGLGFVLRRQGKYAEAEKNFRQAIKLDPGYVDIISNLASTLRAGRKYADALIMQRRTVELLPQSANEAFRLARLPFLARGSTREMDAYLAGFPPDREVRWRKLWAYWRGDFTDYSRLDRLEPGNQLQDAIVLAAQGNPTEARHRLEALPAQLRARLEIEPDNSSVWGMLAEAEALLGHADEAVRCARKAVEFFPESSEPWQGAVYRATLAFVYAWTGDKDRAIAEYARLLRTAVRSNVERGEVINVEVMKRSPEYAPLRGDPRFEALLADPANNQPLF